MKRTVKIIGRGDSYPIVRDENESILQAIVRSGILISAACGGKGTCGKCRIQVIEGTVDITSSDRSKLSEKELNRGYRLACKAYPKEDCIMKLAVGEESDFEVVSNYHNDSSSIEGVIKEESALEKDCAREEECVIKEDCVIGIDIGTTTIAVNLRGINSNKLIANDTTMNKQRAYGADVISRIQASNEGKLEVLRESIRRDLLEGIKNVIEEGNINKNQVKRVGIAGNTTMCHLLMGYSCLSLGKHPYTPVNIETIQMPLEEVLGSDYLQTSMVMLPGISTFVGGDIVAGLLACNYERKETLSLLIDLGTNGEMALGNKDKILVTSAAAGPAFEGGNISCGVGSIPGAISSVRIENDKSLYETIGKKPPVGICGTGVIEITSELVKAGIVDDTGLLDEQYFEDGYEIVKDVDDNPIRFTQKDIREIQLAKAAIRAGVETLILRYGITYDKIDSVYLAGGFGYKINISKAIHIGLLPQELTGKIKTIGNSSLGGVLQYLREEEAPQKVSKILSVCKEISLAKDLDFNDLYLKYMYF